jgi:hypothetical protein
MKKILTAILVGVMFVGSSLTVLASSVPQSSVPQFTPNFRDVGDSHWASEAIDTVSALGIMTGDLAGNFNPNGSIDKFEAVRIFARMSGFNPATQTQAQRAYYDAVFEARRPLIESLDNRFSLWNSQMNREIAFLLYTGVLIASDLENFVVLHNGVEIRRTLNREEAAVYLVRFMGRTHQALLTFGVALFADDHLISPAARPHLYYLRSLGIFNGSEGNANPRSSINRAAMALLVHSTLQEVDSALLSSGNSGSNNGSPDTTANLEAAIGTITNVFPAIRSILVDSASHGIRILPIAPTAMINLNGAEATFAELAATMTFAAILNAGEVVSINVNASPANNGGNNNNNTNQNPGTQTNGTVPPVADMRLIDGVVVRRSTTANTIGIETRSLNPRNEIATEIRDYDVVALTKITRADAEITLANVNVGDLIVAHVYGNTVYLAEMEERVRQMSGTVVDKIFGANRLMPTLVVEDANGTKYNFTADSQSQVRRGNRLNLNTRDLRVGDHVDIWAEYGRITQITARAVNRATIDVYVRDVFISSRGQSYIIVTEDMIGTPDLKFILVDDHVQPTDLALGSRVRLWFDSHEVIGVVTMQSSSTANNFTGLVQNITNNQISVRDDNFQTRSFTFDNNTVFVNSITGQIINVNQLSTGMRVQVINAVSGQNNRAVSVTVLAQ